MEREARKREQTATSILSCIGGSEHRWQILSLLGEGEYEVRQIESELDVPRTTLRHNIKKMEERGLVEETPKRKYRLTPLGRATQEGLETYHSYVSTTLHLDPLFSCISYESFEGNIGSLRDANLTVASSVRPHAPSQRFFELISEATRTIGLLTSLPLTEDQFRTVLSDEQSRLELLFTEEIARVFEEEFSFLDENGGESPETSFWTVDRDAEFTLAVVDETVVILALDGRDKPHVLVETDNDACRSWAMQEFETYRESATPY
ncbi:ArsR family transcriptional regulator [Halorussus salilacus]|uniref:helix-turn-helix transcriptional regulator n=1 Tax=Halorussus salilacus TaxID=2953750 RepID=UPI00209EB4E0|nr:ArsR family transcriptional regulator [Halorussus salilacus]USZ66947.1 ArsR family transcriptional regulator [Halorussus salilacus]